MAAVANRLKPADATVPAQPPVTIALRRATVPAPRATSLGVAAPPRVLTVLPEKLALTIRASLVAPPTEMAPPEPPPWESPVPPRASLPMKLEFTTRSVMLLVTPAAMAPPAAAPPRVKVAPPLPPTASLSTKAQRSMTQLPLKQAMAPPVAASPAVLPWPAASLSSKRESRTTSAPSLAIAPPYALADPSPTALLSCRSQPSMVSVAGCPACPTRIAPPSEAEPPYRPSPVIVTVLPGATVAIR